MKSFKKLSAILLTLSMLSGAVALSADAEAEVNDATVTDPALGASQYVDTDGEIQKGTPIVDGRLDNIYKNSLALCDLGSAENAYGTDWPGTAEADVYFLYDDDYLYICAYVEDDDVLTKGEAFATGSNPYQNDCIEFRISPDGSNSTVKVAVDAYGYACFGLAKDYSVLDYSAILYATTYTDTNYTVEVAIPLESSTHILINDGKVGFTYQLNDINADGKHFNHTTSFAGESVKIPIFYNVAKSVTHSFADCEDNGVDEIKIGTPVIDGKLDSIYKDSLILGDLGRAENAYGTDWPGTAEADVYFLYDDEYLYICAYVEDDDVLTKGEAFATGSNPYQNDCIEFRISSDGSNSTVKVAVDAYGYACFGLANHYSVLDYSAILYKTTYTDTNYTVEVAIPLESSTHSLINDGKVGFTYQLNDINADGKHFNHTTSFAGENVKVPVFYGLAPRDMSTVPQVVLSGGTAAPGGTFELDVDIVNNPGIIGMLLGIDYDSDVFSLVEVRDGGILGDNTHSDNFDLDPYVLFWFDGTSEENYTENGTVATLVFDVADDAVPGEYSFGVSCSKEDALDKDLDGVHFYTFDSTVTVNVLGDANGDGRFNAIDLAFLQRYLAKWTGYDEDSVDISALDVYKDGRVNALDAATIARHLARWVGYETLPVYPK